jgi:IS30 family transposase
VDAPPGVCNVHFCNASSNGPRYLENIADEARHGREYLPKGADLSTVTHAELKAIEARLTGRPRKVFSCQTPDEVFSSLKLNEFIGVALQV